MTTENTNGCLQFASVQSGCVGMDGSSQFSGQIQDKDQLFITVIMCCHHLFYFYFHVFIYFQFIFIFRSKWDRRES